MTSTFNTKTITAESSAVFEKAARGSGSGSGIGNATTTTTSLSSFVSSLPDDIQTHVKQALSINDIERVDNFEISTRSHILQIIQTILEANAVMDIAVLEESVEEILIFIRGIIDFCLFVSHAAELEKINKDKKDGNGDGKGEVDDENMTMHRQLCAMDSSQFRKLPFLLLEDTVDTLPTSIIQVIWKYGPATWLQTLLCSSSNASSGNSNSNNTVSVSLFHQGSKYCLIRMCNRLLKNLSVDAHDNQVGGAQFAGEISMILASVFPLSERSAVNVLGAFHVDNVVEYETLDEWLSCHKNGNGNSGGGISAANGNGNANISSATNKIALNYDFYSKFWGLQRMFTDPKDLVPKANATATTASNATPWNEHMQRFFSHLEQVLEVFEGHTFSADMIKDLSARWNSIKRSKVTKSLQMKAMSKTISDFFSTDASKDDGCVEDADADADVDMEDVENKGGEKKKATSTNAKRQYKYLTNSQLLHLQLQDPEIRIHFISQLFILSSYLSTTLTNYVSTRSGSTIPNKMTCEKMQSKIHQLEKRAGELLKKTPPNGEVHLQTLRWILSDREKNWSEWKRKKCTPPIEKFRVTKSSSSAEVDDVVAKRRRLMGGSLLLGGGAEMKSIQDKSTRYMYELDIRKSLPGISTSMVKQSGIDQFLEEYADALDPEAGIEEEYHPKRNKLSSWKALRCLARNHIGRFGNTDGGYSMIEKKTGDFEGIIRTVWKEEKDIDIPGEMPKAEEISDDEVNVDDEDSDGEGEDEIVKEEGTVSDIGDDEDAEMKDGDDMGEVEEKDESNISTERKDTNSSNRIENIEEVVKEAVSKDEGEIADDLDTNVNNSEPTKEPSKSDIVDDTQPKEKTATSKSDQKTDVQQSENGKGTHTRFSTPAPRKRIEHTKPSQNGHGTHVYFTSPDGTQTNESKTQQADSKLSTDSRKNNSSDGQGNGNWGGEKDKRQDEGRNSANTHQDDRKRKRYDSGRDHEERSKAAKVGNADAESNKEINKSNGTKDDRNIPTTNDHSSRRGNNPRRSNPNPNRPTEQRQQEPRQHNPPQQQQHHNAQQHRRGDSDRQSAQQHRRGESGGSNPPAQQHQNQMRRSPPPGHKDNRTEGGNRGIHTRFTSPPPNSGMHSSGPMRSDDRGGARGGDRGGARGGDRGGARGGDRGGDRGGPRGGDRGGPRGDERGGPRGDERGGPRGDERGGPRGDERGGQRGDERGGPRGGRGQFDRRPGGRGGGGPRRRSRR